MPHLVAVVLAAHIGCAKAPPAAAPAAAVPPTVDGAVAADGPAPEIISFRYQPGEEEKGTNTSWMTRLRRADDGGWSGIQTMQLDDVASVKLPGAMRTITTMRTHEGRLIGTPTAEQKKGLELLQRVVAPRTVVDMTDDGQQVTMPAAERQRMVDAFQAHLRQTTPEGPGRDRALAFGRQMFTTGMLEAQVQRTWAQSAGFFLGADLELDALYEAPTAEEVIVMGSPVQSQGTMQFAVLDWVPCGYDDLEKRCVRTYSRWHGEMHGMANSVVATVQSAAGEASGEPADAELIEAAKAADRATHEVVRQITMVPSTMATSSAFVFKETRVHGTPHMDRQSMAIVTGESGRPAFRAPVGLTWAEARAQHPTQLVASITGATAPPVPPEGSPYATVTYAAPGQSLPAFVAEAGRAEPGPAVIWVTGGYSQLLFPVWEADEAGPFREAGYTVMYPALRGGHPGTGRAEGFLGEVDDLVAAADHLAALPSVDPDRIYLVGHSTGGTLALMAAAGTDRFAGVVAFGPVAYADGYGGEFVYADPEDPAEIRLRSPIHWLHTIATPTWVVEGTIEGNDHDLKMMQATNDNPHLQFALVDDYDHSTVAGQGSQWFAEHLGEPVEGLTATEIQRALAAVSATAPTPTPTAPAAVP